MSFKLNLEVAKLENEYFRNWQKSKIKKKHSYIMQINRCSIRGAID